MHVYVCDIITDHRFVLLFRDSSFLTVFPLISISQLCNRSKISPKKKFSRQSFLEFLPLCIHCQFYVCDQQCLLCRSQEHSNAFLRASLQLFFFTVIFNIFKIYKIADVKDTFVQKFHHWSVFVVCLSLQLYLHILNFAVLNQL